MVPCAHHCGVCVCVHVVLLVQEGTPPQPPKPGKLFLTWPGRKKSRRFFALLVRAGMEGVVVPLCRGAAFTTVHSCFRGHSSSAVLSEGLLCLCCLFQRLFRCFCRGLVNGGAQCAGCCSGELVLLWAADRHCPLSFVAVLYASLRLRLTF